MTFGAAIKSGFKNLTNFKGRARRSEFWWFYLFMVLVSIPLSLLSLIPMFGALASIDYNDDGSMSDADARTFIGGIIVTYVIAIILGLITFFLMLAVWVRRLHDAGYSGHFMWLALAGLSIVPLILAIFDGNRGENQYGPDPKALEYQAWPPAQPGYASPTLAPPPYAAPAAPVAPQATQPLPPADPASDPFAAPPS